MTKKILAVGILSLAVGVVFAASFGYSNFDAAQGNRVSHAAGLEIPISVLDIGPVQRNELRSVEFAIRNGLTKRLVINELDAGCGCSDSLTQPLIVPPGESASLTVVLDVGSATGPIEKRVVFTTNDPSRPRFDVTVLALAE